ncbi:MAG TPA: L-histidine N(alpha)-methyltransferase [Candidatus Acidoferrales bacterium]
MAAPAVARSLNRAFACDVRRGLAQPGQKWLPCKYLYDNLGSALFEAISDLPEYGLTRADERLLRRYSPDIVDRVPGPLFVAELGSGSGRKTRWVLEALSSRQRASYYPIEISASALVRCQRELGDIDSVEIVGFEREYLDGLFQVVSHRKNGERLLLLFLGSSIGNFAASDAAKFLADVREILQPADALLLGTDLEKPASQLVRAYDDELGVTAAFNLNLLSRINRELGGDFDLTQFTHEVRVAGDGRCIEMHIRSKRPQTVHIPAAQTVARFAEGETIWTENSYKYRPEEVFRIAQDSGFRCEASWVDEEWLFSENLFIAE